MYLFRSIIFDYYYSAFVSWMVNLLKDIWQFYMKMFSLNEWKYLSLAVQGISQTAYS